MKTKISRARARAVRARKLPLVLLFFGACRSLSHDGPGNAGDDTETARGHLTASTTPSQALSGRIVVPSTLPDFTSSVSTVGEPSVGHDGSASYRIPLWVPDGVNGLQPSLAVEYNSEGGVGLLGPRWHLSGLSVITRCPKTLAHDGVQEPVNYFGDTFCMDGTRLIVVSGGTSPEFHTERETFTKIVGTKDANGDFVAFTAYRRDGRIFHYGTTLSSRLHGNAMQFYPSGTTTRDVTYAYYVDKIEDRYANSILIRYANAVLTPTSGVSQVQELEPQQIFWGATGDSTTGRRFVTFEYDQSSIPPGSTVDPRNMRWVHGLGIGAAQYLTAVNVFGPNGLGGSPRLKQYAFGYSDHPATRTGQPLITGERVLSTVTEGDPDNRAWKKTTSIEWEAGSLDYTRTVFNAPDVALSDYKGPPTQADGSQSQYADQYRRITAVDLNGDGRDDLVYRAYIPPHHTGYFDCLGWSVRTAQFAPGDTSGIPYLSTPTPLSALGSDPDTSCRASLISSTEYQNAKGPNAYVGDIAFADLNGDGYPDIISPIGKGSYDAGANKQNSTIVGYRAYLGTPSAGPLTFGNPINFLDSVGQPPSIANFNTPKDATIAIGDTWGDGLPTVITRGPVNVLPAFKSVKLDGRGLVAKTETRAGKMFPYSECPAFASCYLPVIDTKFPDGTFATEDLATIDLDGDGTAEVLRNAVACPSGMNCGSMNGAAMVQSPTMSGFLLLPPAVSATESQLENRWFVDLNGDGLLDVAWRSNSGRISTAMNTGAGFGPPGGTSFPTGPGYPLGSPFSYYWFPSGEIMVADFNLDGRQDLISANNNDDPGDPPSSKMVVLLSDGAGGFLPLVTSISPGAGDARYLRGRVARPNLVVDLNGDGLPDVLNLEGPDYAPSTVAGYIRQGRAPMMVTKISEGTGRTIDFGYEVASTKDPFYVVSRSQTCAKDPQHLECLNRGRWLVKSLKVGGSDISAPTTQTFTYKGGVSDKRGRGFLGFIQRDISGPGSRHETITYDPVTRHDKVIAGSIKPYAYPYALLPVTDRVDIDTPQGPNRHHYDLVQNTLTVYWQYNTVYVVNPYKVTYQHFDCPTVSGGTCSGAARELSSRQQFPTFDLYGNVTMLDTLYFDGSTQVRFDRDKINYQAPDTTNWLLTLLDPAKPSTRASEIYSPAESVTRTVRFTPDLTHGGVSAVEIEPSGDATTHLIRTFGSDTRGRLTSISEQEVATGVSRRTDFSYENLGGTYDSDAVHVTKVSRSSGTVVHNQRIWRHPGLGFVVEVDDPNGLAASRSYDTFGRLRSETGIAGASTTVQYSDNPYNGADLAILPEGMDTRAMKVHLDSWGRETSKMSPVDATRVLQEDLAYDAFGRVQTKTIKSGPAGAPTTILNTTSLTYDDLNRLLSDCHLASDNVNHCKTRKFDGRSVAATDEAGRVVTQIADALGRPAIQRAALQGGTSDATFAYGPFDLLEQEAVSDGSGQTKMTYDVLGRRGTLTRTGAGTRVTKYNAFGDVVATAKQAPDGTQAESLTLGRDLLGRLTSITDAVGGNYGLFAWDAPESAPTAPAPYAIGKLVDVNRGNLTTIHHDYGANGLVSKQIWTTSEFSSPREVGSAQYSYDAQGRLSTLTYPSYAWSHPLSLSYAYDPYNGEEKSIADVTDAASPRTPIWSVGARNELGQVASESMKVGAAAITRVTNYYLQTAQVKSATLGGSNGQSAISYSYDADGLPSSLAMSGVGGAWSSTLNHDNLGRLTSWLPVAGGPTVTFWYDGDGNLAQRSWTGEIVLYGNTATGRTVTVSQSGTTVANDVYKSDGWGRIVDTPAATFTYDAMDQFDGVTEKATGRYDFFRRDGFGNRILTAYGNPFNGQGYSLLYTLGDLYEFRTSSTEGSEERCRVRAGGRVVGELVRTWDTAVRTATFLLTDNVGSVVAEASSTGTVSARSRRDPFGNTLSNPSAPYLPPDPAAADPDGTGRMGFGDHPRDAKWGVVDMVSRFYSPRLGRFISPDAILPDAFDRQQHNAFAYVTNSPAALRDPLGFCGEPEGDPCPLPPPRIDGGGMPPPPGNDQEKYNRCAMGECSCGDHDCAQASQPAPTKTTDVKRLAGAPTAGPTSANGMKAATIRRSHGATEGSGLKDTVGDVLAWSCFLFGCDHNPVSIRDPFDPSRRIVLNNGPDRFDVRRKEAELWRKYKVPPTALALKGPDVARIRVPGPVNSPFGKVDYLLGNVGTAESVGKGGFFRGVLGFNEGNLGAALQNHLLQNFEAATVEGTRIRATGTLTGPNGRAATVMSVWQVTPEGFVDLITAVPK